MRALATPYLSPRSGPQDCSINGTPHVSPSLYELSPAAVHIPECRVFNHRRLHSSILTAGFQRTPHTDPVINDLGKHIFPLRDLCNEINRKESLQGIRILECESYTEGSLPPHIYLVFLLDCPENPTQIRDAWLRLDRRMAKGSVWRFLFASSRSVANDEVCWFDGKELEGGLRHSFLIGNTYCCQDLRHDSPRAWKPPAIRTLGHTRESQYYPKNYL